MATPKLEHRALNSEDGKPANSHVDSKVKRMQVFLKKIGKTRKTSSTTASASKVDETDYQNEEDKEETEKTQEVLLKQYEKDVNSAITYYKAILQKNVIQKLPATATAVLESIINAEETIQSCLHKLFRIKEFQIEAEQVVPLKDNLNRSITHLIRMSDNVLFDSYLHVHIDKPSALKAAEAVSLSLFNLYEFVIPRIRKYSLNEELLQRSSCLHSSSNNSLDALDNIPETDILDDNTFYDEDVKSPAFLQRRLRDSDISSEANSNYHSEINLSTNSSNPPPKPPLPNGNRNYYGNFTNPCIRKAVSHPENIASGAIPTKNDLAYRIRPISDFRGWFTRIFRHNSLFLWLWKQ